MGYAGIKGGTAIANILLGKISPSGRLAESYYTNLNDVPSINNFGVGPDVEYAEKLMVGYRGYTTLGSDVLYPFGYGLTYTEFEYVDYSIKKSNKNLEINVVVKNIGSHDAKETVQVYARPIVSDDEWQRPIRELKGFCKKNILSKNKQTFTINIPLEYFKYFSLTNNRWQLSDMYEIEIGPNVRTIKFKELIKGVYTNET
jgi:beta-glucosidase